MQREWERMRQGAKDERDKEVMRGDSVRGGEKKQCEGGRRDEWETDSKEWINTEINKVS